mgnify:CR=1 FL=1
MGGIERHEPALLRAKKPAQAVVDRGIQRRAHNEQTPSGVGLHFRSKGAPRGADQVVGAAEAQLARQDQEVEDPRQVHYSNRHDE